MSEPQHTPGPWQWGYVTQRQREVWSLRASTNEPVLVQDRSGGVLASVPDAHLIEAAPDLYAAAKARGAVEAHCLDFEHAHSKDEVDEWSAELDALQRTERELRAAALAKAEGREVQP